MLSFENTQVAFANKSDKDLKKKLILFFSIWNFELKIY